MITIVFGKPGAGKTAYLAANAIPYLNNSTDSLVLKESCQAGLEDMQERFSFSFADIRHSPVYTNFKLSATVGSETIKAFYIDGFHLGFVNPDVEVMSVLPQSKIFLSEAQRYYDSRKRGIPDWVSHFYEEHRHFGLDIFLDVQRPGLIDANIREIAGNFVEIESCEVRDGSTIFKLKRFDDWRNVESYFGGIAKTQTTHETYPFDVFRNFNSFCYNDHFIPHSGDFWQVEHPEDNADLKQEKVFYRQLPPKGYFKEKR